jgi:hypothetical protein
MLIKEVEVQNMQDYEFIMRQVYLLRNPDNQGKRYILKNSFRILLQSWDVLSNKRAGQTWEFWAVSHVVAKSAYRFVMSGSPFVCPLYQFVSHWTDFSEISYWKHLLKCFEKIQVLLKIGQKYQAL